MASNEPWITLRRSDDDCRAVFGNESKERYLLTDDGQRAGFLILDMTGPFPGYIQSIGVAPEARNRGLGRFMLEWAETRIFRESPNVFLCVSSFNPDALRLYRRLGYHLVGTLTDYVVDGHDELLLRKHRGSWDSFRMR